MSKATELLQAAQKRAMAGRPKVWAVFRTLPKLFGERA